MKLSILAFMVLVAGCGVKSEELEQRLQPMDERIELAQDGQQGLDQRLAVVEASVNDLRSQVSTLAQQPVASAKGVARKGRANSGQAPVEVARMPDGTPIPPPLIVPSPVGRAGAPLVPPSPVGGPAPVQSNSAGVLASGATPSSVGQLGTPTGGMSGSNGGAAPEASAAAGPVLPVSAGLSAGTLAVNGPGGQGGQGQAVQTQSTVVASGTTASGTTPSGASTLSSASGPGTTAHSGLADKPNNVAKPTPVQTPPVKVSTEQGAYRDALKTYEKRQFVESEKAFDAFMQKYPNSSFMPNALYWKGECLYSRGNYADAIFVFKDVIARYGKHGKAPDALLKVSMAYKRLGDKENAALYYRILSEDYPASPAVKRGKELGLSA